jgi:hypothetical protein
MTRRVPPAVSEYMRKIGAKGGANGKGVRKIRKKAHYKNMAKARKKKDA